MKNIWNEPSMETVELDASTDIIRTSGTNETPDIPIG